MINHSNHSAKFSLSLLLLAITLSGCRFGELDLWSAVSSSDESNAESHTTPEELKERWQVAFTALNDALSNKDSQLARRIYSEELEPVGLELAEISGDHYLAFILEANGAIALTSNNIEEALESYENAFSISLESDVDELSVAILASELGHCYRLNGDFEMAAEVLENAIDDMEEHDGAVANRMSAIADLYDCYLKLDDPEKTIDVLERGVATLLPLVSEEFDRIALMSGMVIELSKMTGDNERSQEYGELCRALDSDFQLDTNIRQMLVDSSVLGSTNDFRSQNQQQVLRPESSFAQQNENQQLVAEAQAEYNAALLRYQTAERNWKAEEARVRGDRRLANRNASYLGAIGAGQPHFIYNMDADLYLQREYLNAQADLERAKAVLDHAKRGF